VSTRSKSPPTATTSQSLEDLFRSAIAAGITRREIEALILRGRSSRDGAGCPQCGAKLVPAGDGTQRCTSCGIKTLCGNGGVE
jgi:hypothetical protein